jgi:hypothetical protein
LFQLTLLYLRASSSLFNRACCKKENEEEYHTILSLAAVSKLSLSKLFSQPLMWHHLPCLLTEYLKSITTKFESTQQPTLTEVHNAEWSVGFLEHIVTIIKSKIEIYHATKPSTKSVTPRNQRPQSAAERYLDTVSLNLERASRSANVLTGQQECTDEVRAPLGFEEFFLAGIVYSTENIF